jgi:hypothetical protein
VLVWLALSIAAVIGAVQLLRPEPLPPPRFDEARDLPPIPPDDVNGWALLAAAPRGTFGADARDWPLAEVELAPDDATLATLASERAAILAWSPAPEVVARLDEAWARPRMAFVCGLEPRGRCEIVAGVRAQRLELARSLQDAVRGNDAEALARAERVLRADRDLSCSARDTTQWFVAQRSLRMALVHVALLAHLVESREAPSTEVLARLASLERELDAIDPAAWSLEPALRGEAIFSRRAAEVASTRGRGRLGLVRAVEELDAYHQAAIFYARDPQRAPRPVPPDVESYSPIVERNGRWIVQVTRDIALDVDSSPRFTQQTTESLARARAEIAAARRD